MRDYALIAPEVVLLSTALVVMFADSFVRGRQRAVAWIGAAGAIAAAALAVGAGRGEVTVLGGMLAVDGVAQAARIATCLLTALFLLWLAGRGFRDGDVRHAAALVLLSSAGSLLVASARDWVVLFLAIETASMPLYVLAGIDRRSEGGLEGALKYFLMSMVTSVVMLYGLSFVLGLSGTTAYAGARVGGGTGLFAVALVAVGLLAKLSAAPFHWWAPDAYAGAPPASVAFVSTVPKIAGVAALVRVAGVLAPQAPGMLALVLAAAVASMLLGNLAAYPQRDLRRLMAYSGVAHAGYALLALGSGSASGPGSAAFYVLAYALPSMGVMLIAADEGADLESLAGLLKRRPWMAWALVAFLFSLVGVPPMAGFLGKLYVVEAALGGGLTWLAVLSVLMSVVSAGFYFRVVRAAFFADRRSAVLPDAGRTRIADLAVVLCLVGTLWLGVAAGPLLAMLGLSR